ncbi:MAG: hypothetical protein GY942_04210, partial [Aestuariibacter sp.]|nr:hypothetical protein [Aestuariibacter sp.]
MNKYWWILLLWLPVAQAHYPAQVLKVVDGDTVKVMVEVWPDMFIKTSLRIRGIDTPEAGHKAKCLQELAKARLATEFTRKFVSGPVVVSDVGHGSFARRMV